MDWLKRNPLIGVLAAICVLLAAVIGVEAGFGATLRDAMRPASVKRALPTDAKLLPAIVATAPEQAYPETVARPLFTPTRRPAPAPVPVAKSTFQRGQFVLAGVIVVGANKVAMLREKSNNRIHRVEQGKEVNGIKVAEIQREQVTLAMGAEQEVLTLSVIRPAPGSWMGSAEAQGPFVAVPAPSGAPPLSTGPRAAGPFSAPAGAPGLSPAASPSNPQGPPPTPIGVNPAARAAPPEASSNLPLSPEELLARRRARRTQQTQ
ncbi:MAG: hypothetical protein ABI789_05765 [Usitatibacter sp.]